jgi:hypothetical protein
MSVNVQGNALRVIELTRTLSGPLLPEKRTVFNVGSGLHCLRAFSPSCVHRVSKPHLAVGHEVLVQIGARNCCSPGLLRCPGRHTVQLSSVPDAHSIKHALCRKQGKARACALQTTSSDFEYWWLLTCCAQGAGQSAYSYMHVCACFAPGSNVNFWKWHYMLHAILYLECRASFTASNSPC